MDSFYYTPELEDPNQCSAFSVTTTTTSEYIIVSGYYCNSIWPANALTRPPYLFRHHHVWMPTNRRAAVPARTFAGSLRRWASRAASTLAKLGQLGSGGSHGSMHASSVARACIVPSVDM
ncbi:hypothetical protein V8E53_006342 [Lactarius tabidus]